MRRHHERQLFPHTHTHTQTLIRVWLKCWCLRKGWAPCFEPMRDSIHQPIQWQVHNTCRDEGVWVYVWSLLFGVLHHLTTVNHMWRRPTLRMNVWAVYVCKSIFIFTSYYSYPVIQVWNVWKHSVYLWLTSLLISAVELRIFSVRGVNMSLFAWITAAQHNR